MDKLVEVVGGGGVILVDMLYFAIRMAVYQVIEHIYHRIADCDRRDYYKWRIRRQRAIAHHFYRLAHQIEANDGEHYARRKRQQQTDDLIGFAPQYCADDAAEPRSAYARYQGDDYYSEIVHVLPLYMSFPQHDLICRKRYRERL